MAISLKEGVEIVNESLKTLGYDYQIDTSNDSTMAEGLEKIGAYPPSQRNAIMEQMNLIIQSRNYGVMFNAEKNKFRNFLVDMSPEGFGIEDVFHELIEGIDPLWDGNGTSQEILENLVSYDENKIHKTFHTDKYERQFKSTIDRRNYSKVFTTYGITHYIDTKLANLSWSAEYYFMNVVIDIIKNMIASDKIVNRYEGGINDANGVNNIVEDIKSVIAGFKTPTAEFNKGVYDDETKTYRPVVNMTNSDDDIFIVTTPELMSRLKVQGYSNAFNLSQYELEGRIIYAPSGTELGEIDGKPVYFVALDRRAILIGIKNWLGSSMFVPNVHIVNHWLTVEGLKGFNTWFNAVAFSTDTIDTFKKNGLPKALVMYNNSIDITSDEVNVINTYEYDSLAEVKGESITISPRDSNTHGYMCNGISYTFTEDITIGITDNSYITIS